MKKAVILAGGHQYIVAEGDVIDVNLLGEDKSVTFVPLMIVDGENSVVGTPEVVGAKVEASVENADFQDDKVTVIRFKAKKRVKKIRGHRSRLTRLKVTKITTK